MSFFCNFKSDRCPGPINGNPMNGLCEKVCIQAKKVFDACMRQTQETGLVLNITNPNPPSPTYPLTFVSAKSTGDDLQPSGGAAHRTRQNGARAGGYHHSRIGRLYGRERHGRRGDVQRNHHAGRDLVHSLAEHYALHRGSGGFSRFHEGNVHGDQPVHRGRLRDHYPESRDGSGTPRSLLRLFGDPAVPGIHAGSMRRILRTAGIPAIGDGAFTHRNARYGALFF